MGVGWGGVGWVGVSAGQGARAPYSREVGERSLHVPQLLEQQATVHERLRVLALLELDGAAVVALRLAQLALVAQARGAVGDGGGEGGVALQRRVEGLARGDSVAHLVVANAAVVVHICAVLAERACLVQVRKRLRPLARRQVHARAVEHRLPAEDVGVEHVGVQAVGLVGLAALPQLPRELELHVLLRLGRRDRERPLQRRRRLAALPELAQKQAELVQRAHLCAERDADSIRLAPSARRMLKGLTREVLVASVREAHPTRHQLPAAV